MRAELYRITRAGPGTLSVMARPRSGDWLADEMQAWQQAGVKVVVSLLTPEEQTELGLEDEAFLCEQCQLGFRSFPIPDRALPPEHAGAERLIEEICAALQAGKHVALHCRMGIGRSAMIAAAVMVAGGDTPHTAGICTRRDRQRAPSARYPDAASMGRAVCGPARSRKPILMTI